MIDGDGDFALRRMALREDGPDRRWESLEKRLTASPAGSGTADCAGKQRGR
jgi:hypothetical protein